MAFKISLVAVLIAILFSSSQPRVTLGKDLSRRSQPTKHGEVYRAKSHIDSLIYKLTLDLNTFNEKKTLATVMQKDANKLARIAEEEIALLKPIQHLLDRLVTGNASNGYERCLAKQGGKIPVRIETKGSSLPKHYTINIPGIKLVQLLVFTESSLAIISNLKLKKRRMLRHHMPNFLVSITLFRLLNSD